MAGGIQYANGGVNPLDVAFHLRHFLHPWTATATVAAPFVAPCVYHPFQTDADHAHVHFALHSLDHTARGGPDHLGLGLHNFRGHAAAGGLHLARIDVRPERQRERRLAPSHVSQDVDQRFGDSLGMFLVSQPSGWNWCTFFHVRASTKETTSTIRTLPSCFDGTSTAKSTTSHCCILVHQVSVFRPSALTKVFYLHDLWKQRYIHGRFCCLSIIVPLDNLLVL